MARKPKVDPNMVIDEEDNPVVAISAASLGLPDLVFFFGTSSVSCGSPFVSGRRVLGDSLEEAAAKWLALYQSGALNEATPLTAAVLTETRQPREGLL